MADKRPYVYVKYQDIKPAVHKRGDKGKQICFANDSIYFKKVLSDNWDEVTCRKCFIRRKMMEREKCST